jgi:hypothetical protein
MKLVIEASGIKAPASALQVDPAVGLIGGADGADRVTRRVRLISFGSVAGRFEISHPVPASQQRPDSLKRH